MNKRLRLAVRQAACDKCSLHTQADGAERCVTGNGPNEARIMVVTKNPLLPESRLRGELEGYLTEVGINLREVMWCSAIKCLVWDMDSTKSHLKACMPYLRAEIAHVQPEFVLALGAEAWFAASGWADITKHRGGTYNLPDDCHSDAILFPTISPSAAARSPHMKPGFIADLRYFARLVNSGDDDTSAPPFHHPGDRVRTITTKDGLRDTLAAVRASTVVAWDIETTGGSPWDSDGAIVSVSLTTADDTGMPSARVWQVPLFHPESPWRNRWRQVGQHIWRAIGKVKRNGGHNIKYDAKWARYFGADFDPGWDTIIMLALLDENQPKGLKPTCQQRLGADPWGIDTKDLLSTPLDEVLEYNGLDTWHNLRLYYVLREELLSNAKLTRLYTYLMMPLVQELVRAELSGIYMDTMALAANWGSVQGTLQGIHELLMKHVPTERGVVPDRFFNRKGELQVNFNASNFARWWLFEYLELPVLARGKPKDDGSPGMPSMAEDLMAELAEQHPAAKLMVERVAWNKYDTAFFKPWSEQVTRQSRIHTVFKPWGTVTGRLSSGKEDAEKITAGARNRKGVNLQQVPRNKLARGVFGAPPGSKFVEADYSQIELRIAAFLAQERRMLHLYATGQDIHMATAMQMTGKPASQVTSEERKKAKAVNFGFLYGMGWAKFVHTAWSNYGIRVSEEEARAFREAFFRGFPDLLPWHGRQRKLVRKYGRVQTPMGRIRHLPDIFSPDRDVQAEAERQAINSPVQALASDMAALSLVHVARRFRAEGMRSFVVGPVHDAVNFEVPDDELEVAVPIIKDTMENLPLERLFGMQLTVPIIADVKIGQHWSSDAVEVPNEVVTDQSALRAWLKENVS